jgi:hypothetical protein
MILKKEIFLRETVPSEIQKFLRKTLDAFGAELNHLGNTIYQYPNGMKGIDEKESINDVFALIERSYFGIFNNAVIRSFPKDAVLQEFSVYGKQHKHVGRADYLVSHYINNSKSVNLLFEGKASVANGKNDKKETKEYLHETYKKALKYYEAEKEYYINETLLITIVFEWIRKTKLLEAILNETYIDDEATDYYFIYHTKVAGIMVYGTVISTSMVALTS